MKVLLLLWVVLFSTYLPSEELTLSNLTYYTESFPPYNFEENGFLRGIAVDLLVSATARLKTPLKRTDITLVPWPRGYHSLTRGPNVVLFSTAKTKKRKDLFKWAGPIAKTLHVLLAKKTSQIKIETIEDASKYYVGGIKNDAATQLLIAQGFDANNIYYAADGYALAKQLEFKRIDLWAYDEGVARWFLRRNGLNNDDFEAVFTLSEGDMYYAFSKDVPDKLVEDLQRNIDRIKNTPGFIGHTAYDDILSRYY